MVRFASRKNKNLSALKKASASKIAVMIFLFMATIISSGWAKTELNMNIDFANYFRGYDGAFVFLDLSSEKYFRFNEERCEQQFSPCSTFKIVNSLIALETGVANDENFSLKWNKKQYPIKVWNQDQTLETAFGESCLWFFQEIARRIGVDVMAKFMNAINYGNGDISGGIDKFWLESTLKISPDEQVEFLKKLCKNQLPFSINSTRTLKLIMINERTSGTTIYGKTGTAGDPIKGATMGWYVGFAENGGHFYIFAANISGGENPSGRKAREIVLSILKAIALI